MKRHVTTIACALTLNASADLTIDVGTHVAAVGDTAFEVAIPVVGGDSVSDMTAIVQIGEGGPRVGGSPAPAVAAVSYAGSIWSAAPGGFTSFFPGAPPSSEIIDPNLALLTSGQSVAADGVLLTLTIDTTGFPTGDYPVRLGDTAGGDSTLYRSGTGVPSTIINGILRIGSDLDAWRFEHFGDDVENPSLEASLHGDCADPDQDGYDNITEFVIGTSPVVYSTTAATGTTSGLPSTTSLDTAPEITYSRRTGTSVSTTPEISTDLVTWTGATTLFTQLAPTPIPGTPHELVTLQLTSPPKPPRIYFRLRVTKP